eukprot:TRINITY_DN5089_c2_g1_i1.p1 TRINITY_DN5089_c2_g1~~TRINITY_DN5089_c2_g1_i1.p1  ORF type:complete len:850 (+),score=151.88 TRINITY_DN5089_c2_g1_i1:140-2689(+)
MAAVREADDAVIKECDDAFVGLWELIVEKANGVDSLCFTTDAARGELLRSVFKEVPQIPVRSRATVRHAIDRWAQLRSTTDQPPPGGRRSSVSIYSDNAGEAAVPPSPQGRCDASHSPDPLGTTVTGCSLRTGPGAWTGSGPSSGRTSDEDVRRELDPVFIPGLPLGAIRRPENLAEHSPQAGCRGSFVYSLPIYSSRTMPDSARPGAQSLSTSHGNGLTTPAPRGATPSHQGSLLPKSRAGPALDDKHSPEPCPGLMASARIPHRTQLSPLISGRAPSVLSDSSISDYHHHAHASTQGLTASAPSSAGAKEPLKAVQTIADALRAALEDTEKTARVRLRCLEAAARRPGWAGITVRDAPLRVHRCALGAPAEKAGLRSGDEIVSVRRAGGRPAVQPAAPAALHAAFKGALTGTAVQISSRKPVLAHHTVFCVAASMLPRDVVVVGLRELRRLSLGTERWRTLEPDTATDLFADETELRATLGALPPTLRLEDFTTLTSSLGMHIGCSEFVSQYRQRGVFERLVQRSSGGKVSALVFVREGMSELLIEALAEARASHDARLQEALLRLASIDKGTPSPIREQSPQVATEDLAPVRLRCQREQWGLTVNRSLQLTRVASGSPAAAATSTGGLALVSIVGAASLQFVGKTSIGSVAALEKSDLTSTAREVDLRFASSSQTHTFTLRRCTYWGFRVDGDMRLSGIPDDVVPQDDPPGVLQSYVGKAQIVSVDGVQVCGRQHLSELLSGKSEALLQFRSVRALGQLPASPDGGPPSAVVPPPPSELLKSPPGSSALQPGSLVRVREGAQPCLGWANVKVGDVGKLIRVEGMVCFIEFPAHPIWTALTCDVEIA